MNDEIITSYLLGKKAGGGGTPPVYQDKEVSITQNGETTITKDEGYDALSSVELTVAVPQPSGKINITQNGTDIDVSSYASADVNVPAGADLSEYFNNTISGGYSTAQFLKLIKKFADCTAVGSTMYRTFYYYSLDAQIPNVDARSITDFSECFKSYSSSNKNLDLSGWQFTSGGFTGSLSFNQAFASANVESIDLSSLGYIECSPWNVSMQNTFENSNHIKTINIPNLNSNGSIYLQKTFRNCTSLEELDISSIDFNKVVGDTDTFTGVPTNCLIYVKDQTAKDWFTTNWSSLTNVQIKS